MLAATVALMVALGDASPTARLLVFPFLLVTSVLLMQVQASTCIALGFRGERNLDQGVERIADATERQVVSAQARQVATRSIVIASLITAAYALLH
jgi:hypothetical protein